MAVLTSCNDTPASKLKTWPGPIPGKNLCVWRKNYWWRAGNGPWGFPHAFNQAAVIDITSRQNSACDSPFGSRRWLMKMLLLLRAHGVSAFPKCSRAASASSSSSFRRR
jgi:hypothetical protein